MGDISEIRGLVVIVTFLGVFVVLALLIPTGFFTYTADAQTANIPETFNALDLAMFASTYNITFGDWIFSKNWGEAEFGHEMRFYAIQSPHRLSNTHFYGLWGSHLMNWYSKQGTNRGEYLYLEEIANDWDTQTNVAEYTVKCNHFQMMAWISYNTTKYASLELAWDDEEAQILFAIDFDQQGTSWNAWNIVGALLLFQLPEVHPIINGILNIPLYVAVGYLAYILILRAIGAIFGGGA